MQDLEKSPLWLDIKKILTAKTQRVRFEYKATIHTPKEDFTLTKILMVDIVRDYVKNIGDEVFIQGYMPLGDYVKRFYPYRNNIEITLQRTALFEAGQQKNTNDWIDVERYKALFLVDKNPPINANELTNMDKQSLDLIHIVTIELQLLNRSLEPLRIKTTGGIYKNEMQETVIKALVGGESLKVLVDGKPAIDGLDLYPPDNSEKQRHIVIPQGTHITAIPTFLQERMNGVYNAGIGTYLQTYNKKRYWFIYPLFNYTRFSKDDRPKIIFYATPPYRYPIVERTFRIESDIIYALAMSTKRHLDKGEADLMDKGVGFRQADARAFMGKPVKISKEGPVGSFVNLVTETILKERDDNLNYAPVSDERISSNPFKQFSLVNQKVGSQIKFIWYNANPNLIYPGMPCKYVYLDNNTVKEIRGVVLFVHSSTRPEEHGVLGMAYFTHCEITLYVESAIPESTEVYEGATSFF